MFNLRIITATAVLTLLGLAGCVTDRPPDLVLGQLHKPTNIYLSPDPSTNTLRRVAVLPLTTDVAGSAGNFGRDSLEPEIRAELAQLTRFELVFPTPQQLRQWTGKPAWNAEEALPPQFFSILQKQTGCDAVLFCRLTVYRPYPPVAIGWNLKLAESRKGGILWAADEVFDAGNPQVVNSARVYYQKRAKDLPPLNDSRSILNTPRYFGRYAFHSLIQYMPPEKPLEKGT